MNGEHTDLVVYGGSGLHKLPKLSADRTMTPPLDEGVEDDFVAALGKSA